ncbi:hypothetical protein B0H16DRAFT_1569418 [Mycena metata]|uniref:CsbD-like domain-containing protein n=1 Tax=Mycena metata TaxID=1033252 RepID=A0AAD7ICW6_9AGAR|nr:hypothetical protein B0H16DRAFT_1569418 [Mycena metata]
MSSTPNQTTGHMHSVKGTVVESIGNVTGLDSWKTSGKKEHAEGEAEVKAAQSKEYVEGVSDRVGGKVDEVVGGLTGNTTKEMSGKVQGAKGEVQMDANKPV